MSDTTTRADAQAWADAYGIAYIGASNAAAVARAIGETISALRSAGVTWNELPPDWHPAVRAMVGHLAYLTGQGLGPADDDLRAVIAHHVRTVDDDARARDQYPADDTDTVR